MPLFKKNQRYKVSRRSDFIQSVTLLDGTQMECNLAADSLPMDCLQNVLQRLEVREVALFGLKYFTPAGQLRWADFDMPIKKQLEKYASSQMLCIGIFYYIEKAYALQDEPTRYQYYLQLKSDVLDSRLYCTLEQAILLAGYALQAEYQNYDDARQSPEYIKEIERLDNTLLPRNLVAEYHSTSALADIAQHIVTSHIALSGMSSSQAEIAYIHLAQQMDSCGVEYAKAVTVDGEEVYIGSCSTGITVRRQNGNPIRQFSWSQISELTCFKKYLQVNVTTRKLSTKFILENVDTAKYVHRVFTLQQEFFHDSPEPPLYSDEDLAAQQYKKEPLLSPTRHATQLSNISNSVIYDSTLTREKAVDVIEEEPATSEDSEDDSGDGIANTSITREATPDLLDNQYDSEYATMKFKKDPVPLSERPRAMTASLYAGSRQTPLLDQLHKNELLHRSMTALQEYRDSLEQQQLPGSQSNTADVVSNPPKQVLMQQYPGSVDHLNTYNASHNMAAANVLSRSMHGLELSAKESGLPTYRPSPDYDMVMKQRAMQSQAIMSEAYNHQQTVRELQNGAPPPNRSLFTQYIVPAASQPDFPSSEIKEPVYVNLTQQPYHNHLPEGESKASAIDRNQQPTPYQNHSGVSGIPPPGVELLGKPAYYSNGRVEPCRYSPPDLIHQPQASGYPAPDITSHGSEALPYVSHRGSPDVISGSYLKEPGVHLGQGPYRSADNFDPRSFGESRSSVKSQQSARSSGSRVSVSPKIIRLGSNMSANAALAALPVPKLPLDERITILEDKLNSDDIVAEYESVLKKKHPADCRVALRPENGARNRFPNVLPYEDTRVRLIASPTNPTGYINASHVEMDVGREKLTYIATQNPLPDTIQDFWQMIWAYNVTIVTMVTELEEMGTQKCPLYWPSNIGPNHAISVNDLKIVLKHSAPAQNYTISCLRVGKSSTKEKRTIWHIKYTAWHQNGCPEDVHGFLALLDELNSVRLHIQTKNDILSPRMLVHCSTGVGRSGVLILTDVMKKFLENKAEISVASTLKELRQQRMYMVQTLPQYKFVHEVLVRYLKGARLI